MTMTPKQMISEHRRRHNVMAGHYWVELAEQMGAEIERLRAAMQDACELLAERTQGSGARSPGHNARLRLEAALEQKAVK
jgi:hypothetical protein